VRVGLQVPETLLDKRFFRIGLRPAFRPVVLGLDRLKTSDGALRTDAPHFRQYGRTR
jgi:hypothetical protein